MVKYTESTSALGARIMKFRKTHKLTQADLAERYKVSGPAIFKFEKGFVIPSLKLWQTIANDMGIPEKEAVLIWAKEKLPGRFHVLLKAVPEFDVAQLRKEMDELGKGPNSAKQRRDIIMSSPDISPSLKKFVSNNEIWEIFKPTVEELVFLIELDKAFPRITVAQFREAMIVARQIQQPGK
jgi:transcriptional regulator with XRE-family HTH domain